MPSKLNDDSWADELVSKGKDIDDTSWADSLTGIEKPKVKPVEEIPKLKSSGISQSGVLNISGRGSIFPGFPSSIKSGGRVDEFGNPVNEEGKPINVQEKVGGVQKAIGETVKGLTGFASHPMETIRGGADFFLSIPGFMTGMVTGAQRSVKEGVDQIANGMLDLDKIYNTFSEGMTDSMKFFDPAKELLVGKPTEESSKVGEVAMAPLSALSYLGQSLAGHEGFKEYPNIRGALKFAGDISGFLAMGVVMHGSSGKATYAKKIEDITNKSNSIVAKEKAINEIPNEVIKQNQKKILNAEKVQLELEAKELTKMLSGDGLIREELGRQAEEVAKAKTFPVEKTGIKKPTKGQVKKVFKGQEKVEEVKPTKEVKSKIIEDESWTDVIIEDQKPVEVNKDLQPPPTKIDWSDLGKEEETIKPVDEATGTDIPELKNERSPFFQTKEKADQLKTIYEDPSRQNSIKSSPEVATQKLINDVNRWAHGDESIDINKVRNDLSTFASRSEDLRYDYFDSSEDFNIWKDTVEEAATWARNLDRLKNQRTNGIKLNMMIPVDEIPQVVRDVIHGSKKLFNEYVKAARENISDIYRNEEIWKKTGYWLGKDGKWRYELDNSKINYRPSRDILETYRLGGKGFTSGPVSMFADISEVIKAVPELKDLYVIADKRLKVSGNYNSARNEIRLRDINDKKTFFHELNHAVMEKLDAFRGSSIETQEAIAYKEFISQVKKSAKNQEVLNEIEKIDNLNKENKLISTAETLDKIQEAAVKHKDYDTANLAEGLAFELFDKGELFRKYRETPGEMESRLVEERLNMTAKQRAAEPPWITLDRMLEREHLKDPSKFKEYSEYKDPGNKLYSMFPADEAYKLTKQMVKNIKDFTDEHKRTMKMKDFDFKYASKKLYKDIGRAINEQSEPLMKYMIKNYGSEGDRIVHRQRSAITGFGYGNHIYGQIIKEVYGGKNNGIVEAINIYTNARRFKDIYSYKPKYKHQKGYSKEKANSIVDFVDFAINADKVTYEKFIKEHPEILESFKGVKQEDFVNVKNSAEALFNNMKLVVDDLVSAGILSEKSGENLKAHDFRKFTSLTIEEMIDPSYSVKLGDRTIDITNSGVESLGKGKLTLIEPDARVSTADFVARAYGAISNQKAKIAWRDFAAKHPDNGIVLNEKKAGYIPIPYFENGKKNYIYFNGDIAKYIVTKSVDMSGRLTEILDYATFAKITRPLAVGLSPVWSTFYGLPMDVMHTLVTAKTFDPNKISLATKPEFPYIGLHKGGFKKVYSAFNPVSPLMLGKDIADVLPDIYTRGEFYKQYLKYGGSMPFLSMRQNRYVRGVKPPGDFAKLQDLLSYHGVSLELAVRAATTKRVISNKARELGISFEDAMKNEDIMFEAVHSARDRMDYNQGGWMTKALDKSGFIFLNAGYLGARTYWRSAKETPLDFTIRNAQIAIAATGVAMTGWTLYPHIMKDIPDEGNEKNVTFPLFPDWLNFKDENGDVRYFYGKLRMEPGTAFAYKSFDAMTRTYLYDRGIIKYEPDHMKLVNTLKQLGPVGLSLPPHIQFWVDYNTNYSWWKNRTMYTENGGKAFSWPDSQHEGIYGKDARDPNISQLATDISSVTKQSAKRLDDSIGNILPRNNEFVYAFGKAYEEAFSDIPEEVRKHHWLQTLAETPLFSRIVGITVPEKSRMDYNRKNDKDEDIKNLARNGKLDFMATNLFWKGYGKKKDILDFINSQKDVDKIDNMTTKMEFIESIKPLQHRSFWLGMYHMNNTAKAKDYVNELRKSSPEEKQQLVKELGVLMDAGGYVTDGFLDEVEKVSLDR